jgi:hypothetical protein
MSISTDSGDEYCSHNRGKSGIGLDTVIICYSHQVIQIMMYYVPGLALGDEAIIELHT